MTLDEFVLFFGRASKCLTRPAERGLARHWYLGLGLDLVGAVDARQQIFDEMSKSFPDTHYADRGSNVPQEFEDRLVEKLESEQVPPSETRTSLKRMMKLLLQTVFECLDYRGAEEPFCCDPDNARNRSSLPAKACLYRYVGLDTFESYFLFPGARNARFRKQSRRAFYDPDLIERFKTDPRVLGLKNLVHVWLGRGRTKITLENASGKPIPVSQREIPVPVFFCLDKDAPHRKKGQVSAFEIAAKLGLPAWLKYEDANEKQHDGIAALKYRPEGVDRFYRPTILDALDHAAFRPGPTDTVDGPEFRFGLTCVFKADEFCWENPNPTNEPGVTEVIMKNRQTDFPSDGLVLEAVFFYE